MSQDNSFRAVLSATEHFLAVLEDRSQQKLDEYFAAEAVGNFHDQVLTYLGDSKPSDFENIFLRQFRELFQSRIPEVENYVRENTASLFVLKVKTRDCYLTMAKRSEELNPEVNVHTGGIYETVIGMLGGFVEAVRLRSELMHGILQATKRFGGCSQAESEAEKPSRELTGLELKERLGLNYNPDELLISIQHFDLDARTNNALAGSGQCGRRIMPGGEEMPIYHVVRHSPQELLHGVLNLGRKSLGILREALSDRNLYLGMEIHPEVERWVKAKLGR